MIHLRPAARDALLSLDKPTRRGLQHAIDALAAGPPPAGAVGLSSPPGAMRVPVGDHQLIYEINENDDKEVLILLIGRRSQSPA